MERFFLAWEHQDWSTMRHPCVEDAVYYPPPSTGIRAAEWLHGEVALQQHLAPGAASARWQTFLQRYYAALPRGLAVRYVHLWTTPEEALQREAKVALFHFRGERIAQVRLRPQVGHRLAEAQTG